MKQNFKLPDNFINKNPNIIKQIKTDIDNNNNFHYLFIGCVGSGKTYLAESIANHFENSKFISARQIYREYLTTLNSNVSDKVIVLRKKIHCMRGVIVILDDLGAEKPRTEASRSFIEDIIEDRYEWIKKGLGHITIITTNLSGNEISKLYGDRVLDRIYEVFTIMKFKNYSFRSDKIEIIEN